MSVNCHNSGRIGWSNFADSLTYKIRNDGENFYYEWYIDEGKTKHFFREIINTVKEFSETYKEKDDKLNPNTWEDGDCTISIGPHVCYIESLFMIYIQLNLILLDTKLNKTHLLKGPHIYGICMGHFCHSYRHDEYMANECVNVIKKIFGKTSWDYKEKDTIEINISSKEIVSEIREYLKKVFICLINLYKNEEVNEDFHEIQFLNMMENFFNIKRVRSEKEGEFLRNRVRKRAF